jgi:NADH-quinone oxidoreductase subunit G
MLRHICQSMGWRDPAYFMDPAATSKVKTAVARWEPELVVSLREVETADFILCLGADPINEAPMLALAMRQAQRKGAKILMMDPRPISLPLDFEQLPAAPQDLSGLVGFLIKAAVSREAATACGENAAKFYEAQPDPDPAAPYPENFLTAAANSLKNSRQPVIVCGTDILPRQGIGMAADLALLLRASGKTAGLFCLLPGANAFGAGILSDDHASLANIIAAIERGEVKSLILTEADAVFHYPDRKRLVQALNALDLLLVVDYLTSEVFSAKMQIFIPSTPVYEADGIFVNQEGRAQMVRQAYSGGIPIVQSGAGDHPPRNYGAGIPGLEPKPAWRILAELAEDETKPAKEAFPAASVQWLTDTAPELADINLSAGIPEDGLRIQAGVKADLRFAAGFSGASTPDQESAGNLRIVFTDLTFGTEVLSARSECLWELEAEPAVIMHARDAAELNLIDGNTVEIQTENGRFEATLKVVDNMAAGVLVVPRHRRLAWQIFESATPVISREQIKKVGT